MKLTIPAHAQRVCFGNALRWLLDLAARVKFTGLEGWWQIKERINSKFSCATSSVKGGALLTAEELTFLINFVCKNHRVIVSEDAGIPSSEEWPSLWQYAMPCIRSCHVLCSRAAMKIYLMLCGSLIRILGFKRNTRTNWDWGGGAHWQALGLSHHECTVFEEASFDMNTTHWILKFVCYSLLTICAKLLKQR
jgi:hypothetical protein